MLVCAGSRRFRKACSCPSTRSRATNTRVTPRCLPVSKPLRSSVPTTRKCRSSTAARRRTFVCSPGATPDETGCATRILSKVARQAYRRPVTDEDLTPLLRLYHEGRSQGTFETGIQQALQRILASPDFLFRFEYDPADVCNRDPRIGSAISISPHVCPSFSGAACPTSRCWRLAIRGELGEPGVLEQHVRRMMADVRARALIDQLRRAVAAAPERPALDARSLRVPRLRRKPARRDGARDVAVPSEPVQRGPQRARAADRRLHVSERTSRPALRRVERLRQPFPPRQRQRRCAEGTARSGRAADGDLLSQSHRADHSRQVAARELPRRAAATAPAQRAGAGRRRRRRAVRSRCASGWNGIAPIRCARAVTRAWIRSGSRWRISTPSAAGAAARPAPPIDASGTLPDGSSFAGPRGLRTVSCWIIAKSSSRRVAERLLTYALGRGVEYYDMPAVRAIVRTLPTTTINGRRSCSESSCSQPVPDADVASGAAGGDRRGGVTAMRRLRERRFAERPES